MICPRLSNLDLSQLTPLQLREILKKKWDIPEQAAMILSEFLRLLREGWSAQYAAKCLKINSTIIPCMTLVRNDSTYIRARSEYASRVQKLKNGNKSQLSLSTDDKRRLRSCKKEFLI